MYRHRISFWYELVIGLVFVRLRLSLLKLVSWNYFWTILMFFDENLIFLKQFRSLLEHFWKHDFWYFWVTKLEKCLRAKFHQNHWNLIRFALILLIFLFFGDKFWKIVELSTKSWFSGFRNFVIKLSNLCDEFDVI